MSMIKLARQALAEELPKIENGDGDSIVYDGWITRRMRALGYCAGILDDPSANELDLHIAIKTKDHIEKLP